MMKTVLTTRRKRTVEGGANRALVTIPKGTLAKAFPPLRETALSVETAPADAHSPGTRLRPEPGLSRVCRSQRVDEHRQQVDENRKMRAYLAPLFDALPCGVLIADSANRFRMANAEACRILFGNAPGGVSGAAKLAGFETELARVLKTIADSETRFFQLGAANRSRLVKVARFCLTAEQGLAADRVYLLQTAAGIRSEESKKETGATS